MRTCESCYPKPLKMRGSLRSSFYENVVVSTGKIDLIEFKNIELERIREYIGALLNDSSLRRIPSSKASWLWHDEDELLRYQPELLDGFHERSVNIGFTFHL